MLYVITHLMFLIYIQQVHSCHITNIIIIININTLNIRTELEAFYYKISRNNLTCEQQTKVKQSLHAIDRNYDNILIYIL